MAVAAMHACWSPSAVGSLGHICARFWGALGGAVNPGYAIASAVMPRAAPARMLLWPKRVHSATLPVRALCRP